MLLIRGGAGKSFARPTSRCRRTESIVSLERMVCSCAELQVFSCYRDWREACQATRAISTTSRRELSSSLVAVACFLPGRAKDLSARPRTSTHIRNFTACSRINFTFPGIGKLRYRKFSDSINLLKPTSHVMHQQFNIQQLYALPTLYLCVLYLSENKQRLVPLTA